MKKGAAIDLIILNVSGGKLSLDNAVKHPEVAAYLDIALADALKASVFESLALDRAIAGSSPIVSTYGVTLPIYSPYVGTPTKDTDRGLYKLTLPALIPLINDWAIQAVYPQKNPNSPYIRLRAASDMSGAENLASDMFHVEQNVLWFHGYSLPATPVVAMICKSPSEMEDEDELPYPDDVVSMAVKVAVEWFSRQAGTPADPIGDNKAPNEQ